jgi:hypothetical protein
LDNVNFEKEDNSESSDTNSEEIVYSNDTGTNYELINEEDSF